MDQPINGRVAVVTGAGGGFGRLISQKCAALGARVACADIHDEGLNETVASIGAADGEAVSQTADVASFSDMQRLAATAVDRFGAIDVIVNNAGIMPLAFYRDHAQAMEASGRSHRNAIARTARACPDVAGRRPKAPNAPWIRPRCPAFSRQPPTPHWVSRVPACEGSRHRRRVSGHLRSNSAPRASCWSVKRAHQNSACGCGRARSGGSSDRSPCLLGTAGPSFSAVQRESRRQT